jgi:hypothetical protein
MQPFVLLEPYSFHLDDLIAKLKDGGENRLVIEHLQTAQAYLHGAMPDEAAHNLELARESAASLSSKSLEDEVKETIAHLLPALHPLAPAHWRHRLATDEGVRQPATAKGLAEFFHGADATLGMFYPKKHVVAVFPSFALAESARDLLSEQGFRRSEAIAVPGYEVEEFLAELREHHLLWNELMMHFSRLLDTEAGLVDRYSDLARRGAGFLVAYSPTQEQAEGVSDLLKPLDPTTMHWFMAGYIRDMS